MLYTLLSYSLTQSLAASLNHSVNRPSDSINHPPTHSFTRARTHSGIGVRTVVSDNPEADQNWLWGIFSKKLQVLGDPFHYLQEFGNAATKRSSKVGLWAMAVSSIFWIANKDDVDKEKLWREKQQSAKKSQKKAKKNKSKGKNTAKSNPKHTRYGKNPHVRHTPASKETFLAGLNRAKEFAKNVLKIKLNYSTLEAATDRIKLAFDNGHLDEVSVKFNIVFCFISH